ncbi:MAG: hypothetical protein H6719_02525 [Sandaracinaceae bacterium]|nr:hypothetical protein [Sandaracinaceae bacterium]
MGQQWGALLVGALLAAGCSVERVARDGECALNSDCQESLVCADGRCRVECAEDRDCDLSWRCAPSGSAGRPACQPPDGPALCAFTSECPEGALCVDRRCRAECREDRDCLDGARCDASSGTCESPLVTGAPDGGLVDGGPEAGLVCGQDRATCGTSCVDLASSRTHCGACGNRCPDNETCSRGACECAAPYTVCGALCADLAVDEGNCGGCGSRCDGPCHGGTCCGAGRAFCGGACIDVSDDPRNCGDCGAICDGLGECRGGACRAVNDECEGALDLALVADAPTSFRVRPQGQATPSSRSCTTGPDLFFAFTLAQREIVHLRASGQGVSLGLIDGDCSVAGALCTERVCGGSDDTSSAVLHVLDAGRHVFVVSAASNVVEYSLQIQHVPVADPSPRELPAPPLPAPDAGTATPAPFSIPGVLDPAVSTPGTCGGGPDRAFYWVTCPEAATGTLTASTCGSAFESILTLVDGDGGAGECATSGCAMGSRLEARIESGSGLHVLFVDSLATDAAGAFTLVGSRP